MRIKQLLSGCGFSLSVWLFSLPLLQAFASSVFVSSPPDTSSPSIPEHYFSKFFQLVLNKGSIAAYMNCTEQTREVHVSRHLRVEITAFKNNYDPKRDSDPYHEREHKHEERLSDVDYMPANTSVGRIVADTSRNTARLLLKSLFLSKYLIKISSLNILSWVCSDWIKTAN